MFVQSLYYFLLLCLTVTNTYGQKCRANETLQNQGYDCPDCVTLQHGYLKRCLIKNETKCYCNPGFVRFSDAPKHLQDLIGCISREDCRTYCGQNEILENCGNPCQPSCSEPNRQPCPTLICYPGCFCKSGFIRDDRSGICIQRRRCPVA